MKVHTSKPFQIIYSLYHHEYLGYVFESFVVQLDENGKLTLQNQNISAQNADEFHSGLDSTDYELIKTMDSMQQEAVIKRFHRDKKIKPDQFFEKVFKSEKKDDILINAINEYMERRRTKILEKIDGKMLFEMGRDGEPTWKQIKFMPSEASVLFHFRVNEDNTHYFPTIKYEGERIEFCRNGSYIVCNKPARLVTNHQMYAFEGDIDGQKLKPFLNKKFILIPKKIEDTYYRKFVAPLVAGFNVYAVGFDIITEKFVPKTILNVTELASNEGQTLSLFGNTSSNGNAEPEGKVLLDLNFNYGSYSFKSDPNKVSVSVEKIDDKYVFHRVRRDGDFEKSIIGTIAEMGVEFKNSRSTLTKTKAFTWLSTNHKLLTQMGIDIVQHNFNDKTYFLGESNMTVEVNENIDWFDIHALIKFGEFEIPFIKLRKVIKAGGREILLPNNQIGIIPEHWLTEFHELFSFVEQGENGEDLKLKKHHLSVVNELESMQLAKVTMDRKLNKLRNFSEIEDVEIPKGFIGTLRPYQQAGYNWMNFLNTYNFGGCLADDMGLGKTIQTLVMLQNMKANGVTTPSLLIMPTSLIYNWEMEAKKFTPELRILIYTGTFRSKNPEEFLNYDLILTSYGITRIDIEILSDFYFHYVILDESQAIKNPGSNISKAVRQLKSKRRLILTGTPLENSTLDLWSQMSFINPGLLGNEKFFKKEFQIPIEKKRDEEKSKKLYSLIKPFILRRHKSQVATDLPEKVENIKYCPMTEKQREQYEEVKSVFRDKIIQEIEENGLKSSNMILLQGLLKLRQIANHPRMADENYTGDSGKMEDVTYMLDEIISEGHKVLVFSQFVKHLSIVKEYLNEQKIPFCYLDGSTKDRMGEVEKFQSDESIKIFLISLKAGGVGLNLTAAEYVFLLDPWWNPAIEAQAIDRAHRIGQVNRVFTYKFITKDTVEEKILMLQQRKLKLATDLITTEESFVKDLSKEDIEMILA